jgi:hypothetical protein
MLRTKWWTGSLAGWREITESEGELKRRKEKDDKKKMTRRKWQEENDKDVVLV